MYLSFSRSFFASFFSIFLCSWLFFFFHSFIVFVFSPSRWLQFTLLQNNASPVRMGTQTLVSTDKWVSIIQQLKAIQVFRCQSASPVMRCSHARQVSWPRVEMVMSAFVVADRTPVRYLIFPSFDHLKRSRLRSYVWWRKGGIRRIENNCCLLL